ncbi:hypothetical protein D3C76_728680 [compost metagenome]
MRVQPVRRRQITQPGEILGHSLLVRIVAGHQQFSGTEFGAHRQHLLEIGHQGVRFQPQDFHIQDTNAGVAQTRQGLAPQIAIRHQREMVFLRRRRHQAQADMAVTGPRRDLDHVRW